jgi:glycosyltransferase involved in cell wall biosynthesis
MNNEIWIAGYPSFLGGADSEILHLIDLWVSYGVGVNLVPMHGCDEKIKSFMTSWGVKTHQYRPDIFKDKIVGSWCNGNFLSALPEIMQKGKPRCVVWANCMTWSFADELKAHKNGWIDYFVFVSNYQKKWLAPEYEKIAPFQELEGYKPYFNPTSIVQDIKFNYRKPEKWFASGRISRDDGHKFSDDMWSIFNKVLAPIPKKTFILGYGPNAHRKCGSAPSGLDWQTFAPGEIPVKHIYNTLHCIIHKTGGSRESYCRIVPEAYGYGVPVIVEDDYAFPDLVVDGVTGFRCKSSDEMAFHASELAFDEEKRKKMIFAAHDFLINEIASREKCWQPWKKLLESK